MKRKGILLIVALFAVASLMAAMAYSNVLVDNDTNLTVVSTDNALLRISPLDDADGTAFIENGRLKINFNKGTSEAQGLQPGSEYTWNRLFLVSNHSNNTYNLRVKLLDNITGAELITELVKFDIWSDENAAVGDPITEPAVDSVFVADNHATGNSYNFPTDHHKPIGVKITVSPDATPSELAGLFDNLNIQVISERTITPGEDHR